MFFLLLTVEFLPEISILNLGDIIVDIVRLAVKIVGLEAAFFFGWMPESAPSLE